MEELSHANRINMHSNGFVYKVWSSDNLIYGPVDLPTLIQWVEERRVQPDTWIHWETANDWVAAGDIEELRDTFAALPPQVEVPSEGADESGNTIAVSELRQHERFDPYSNDELEMLLSYCDVVPCPKGDLIIKKGDLSDAMFLVLSGKVRARLKVGGHDTSLGSMEPGELFGEVAMLSRTPRSADVIAEEPTRLLRLTSDRFQAMISEHPPLASKMLYNMSRFLATRLSERNVELQKDLASAFVWR